MPKSKKKRAARPALAFAPELGRVADLRDCYVNLCELRRLAKSAQRWWTFHGLPTTVELPERRYAKLWDRFPDHADPDDFAELLREYESLGVSRPSGYADIFHAQFPSPRVPWSVNRHLAPAFAGGWQQALNVGIHQGTFYRYDIRSAYLWAGSLGMPDTRTYRRSTTVRRDIPGVYRVVVERPTPGAPYPYNVAREVLISSDEIEQYEIPVKHVVTGVTWTRELDPAPMLDAIRAVSTWKQAGRSYWGRWGQIERIRCNTTGKAWNLPNASANIPYAHLIVARVKSKVWNAADPSTVHVYVDSIITGKPMGPGLTGAELGAWKLEQTYPAGVIIKGPGQYGDLRSRRLDKMAGAPKDSPLRDILANKYHELLAG